MEALESYGALVITHYVTSAYQHYRSGIFDDPAANNCSLNHAIALIGYSEEDGNKYWKIRNSWGKWWGEDGYMRLKRTDEVSKCTSAGTLYWFTTAKDVEKVEP